MVLRTSPRWVALSIAALSIVVLLACESTTVTPMAASYAANPPAVTSVALQPTVEQAQVDMYLDAVRAERMQREAQSTLEALAAFQTATAQAVQATATQQAWSATVTAQVAQATSTAVAWQATTEALHTQATATALTEARNATATAQIASERATATAHANAVQATSTAQVAQATATVEAVLFQQRATETAVAWAGQATATNVAWVARSTGTAEAVLMQSTVQAASAEKARLSAERERITYPVRAYGPWVFLGMVGVLLIWMGYRFSKVMEMRARVVKMGPQEREIILLDDRLLQPGRGHFPVLDYKESPPATAEDQRMTTARAQAVELMRASHPPASAYKPPTARTPSKPRLTPAEAAQRMVKNPGGHIVPGLRNVRMLRKLDQAEKAGYIPPSLVDALSDDWERLKDG